MIVRFVLALGFAVLMTFAPRDAFAIAGVDKAPEPTAPHEAKFARPTEATLANGLHVIVAERHSLPLVAAQLVVRSGSEADPMDRAGTATMTGSLLTKGTDKMSAPEIAGAIESLGGTIGSGAGWDSSYAVVVVMSDKLDVALGILGEVVQHPTFKQEEIDRLKKQTLDRLQVSLQQPGTLLTYVATRVLFPSGPYAHPGGGTIESLNTIRRDDIAKLYTAYYRPDNAVLIFSGDITLEQGKTYAEKFFGGWKANDSARPAPIGPAEVKDWKPQNIVVDMPQAGQAAVSLVKPAIKRNSPDYYAGVVANAALGNGFASRLNREIRIKRGLSYGARSFLDTRRDAGTFGGSAQTKNESAAEVANLLQVEARKVVDAPVQGDELKSRQAMLIGGYARSMETNGGIAQQISALVVDNLPLDTLDKYIPAINAVSTADITAFAKKYFATPASILIAGQAPAFIDALKKQVPDVKVIPQKDLDLNRPELVKPK
jgi:zinc protease